VLEGLKERLLAPEVATETMRTYAAEMNRLNPEPRLSVDSGLARPDRRGAQNRLFSIGWTSWNYSVAGSVTGWHRFRQPHPTFTPTSPRALPFQGRAPDRDPQ
jgi:hypothetical protein